MPADLPKTALARAMKLIRGTLIHDQAGLASMTHLPALKPKPFNQGLKLMMTLQKQKLQLNCIFMHNAAQSKIQIEYAAMPAIQTTPAALLLEAKGIRATGARLDVLGILLTSPQALTHLELHARLPLLDRVTLYRALDCLCSAGIAHKIPAGDRIFRYSAQAPLHAEHGTEHGHFQCTRCARIFCLSDAVYSPALREQLQTSLQSALGQGFFSDQLELNIKGCCPDCSK